MSDHEAMAAAGKASIGNKRDLIPEPAPHDGARRGQHLAHARPPARSLVADDDDVAGAHAPGENGRGRAFLALEHPRTTLEALTLLSGHLRDRPLGGEVAVEHHEVAVLLQRLRERTHNVLPAHIPGD